MFCVLTGLFHVFPVFLVWIRILFSAGLDTHPDFGLDPVDTDHRLSCVLLKIVIKYLVYIDFFLHLGFSIENACRKALLI